MLDNWLIQTIGVLVVLPELIAGFVALAPIITSNVALILAFWSDITSGLQGKDIADAIRSLSVNIIVTLLIIILSIGAARTLMKLIIGRLGEQRLDVNIRTLIGRIFYALIVMISVFWILSLWQIAIVVPIAVISALSVAFTFSIQDILKDLVAGLYLLMERPFHIGDQISTASYTGKVENVELRATRIRLISGEDVTIPNMLIFGGIVINNTQFDERRATIALTIPQAEFDKDETPEKILKIVREIEHVLPKPDPVVFVTHFAGAFGGATGATTGYTSQIVILSLRFWIPVGHHAVVTEVMSALHNALPNVDIAVEDSGGNI